MNIAIIGAGGAVGRQIAQMIVAERLLECDQRLILVGNENGRSANSLPGLAVDLVDAYAEICPQIDVLFDPEAVEADLIVMAAGTTMPVDHRGEISRDLLIETNVPIFERYAAALAKCENRHSIVVCISNPNELAVASFSKHLGRRRVIGMGAFLDSLRFRKEIAHDLGIHRQKIHGFMIGEHGANMVPLWSSIHAYGYDDDELNAALDGIRQGFKTSSFFADCTAARVELTKLINESRIPQAYAYIDQFPPDIRTSLKPFVTHFSGAKTAFGTARSTMLLLEMIALGSDSLISGQITLEGEFHGIHSTIGTPFVVGNKGVDRVINLHIDEDEETLVRQCAESIQSKIDAYI